MPRLRDIALMGLPGFAAGLAVVAIGGLAVVEFGIFDTTAATPHLPVVAWATHTTLIHSVRRDAREIKAPAAFTSAQVMAGAREYDADCSACHGAPGVARATWAAGLNPTPPYLLDATQQWNRRELYWIVRQGVKMTAMPAWGVSRSDNDVWNVVAFLEAEPALSPADYARLRLAGKSSPSAEVNPSLPKT